MELAQKLSDPIPSTGPLRRGGSVKALSLVLISQMLSNLNLIKVGERRNDLLSEKLFEKDLMMTFVLCNCKKKS